MQSVKLPFYARLALTLFAIALIYWILGEARDILIPLVFATLIAVVLFPLCRFFEHTLRFPRAMAALLCVIIFTTLIICLGYVFIVQVVNFSDDLPELQTRSQKIIDEAQFWLSNKLHINRYDQMDYLKKSANNIITSAADSLSNVFRSVAVFVLWTVFIFIYTFFILFHRDLLIKFASHLFSEHNRDKVGEVIQETKGIIYNYIGGLLIEMLLVGIVNCSMFEILGMKYAMLLGIMAAILNIIPYLGIYTSIIITATVTFAYGTPVMAFQASIGLFIVHLLDSNILMPRIVGGRVKMNSFVTILAVVLGNMVWGIPGMFLFIPVAGIMKVICERTRGLEAWAILMGVEERVQKKKSIVKK